MRDIVIWQIRQSVPPSTRLSVCLFVRLSNAGAVPKRMDIVTLS